MRAQIRFIVPLACAMLALILALRFADRVPDFVDGLLFGVVIGSLLVLYATRGRARLS